jgi:enamine deaminase RidA (YjgF/YER057c/UK114 family)
MLIEPIDPPSLPETSARYTHGTQVTGARKLVFVSGQPPWGGELPTGFDEQCRIAWGNVLTVLGEAGLGAENLVKVTVFLGSREYREANSRIRAEILGSHRPALTVIICDIYAEEWLLEIEAIAAA